MTNRRGKKWKQLKVLFSGSKTTADNKSTPIAESEGELKNFLMRVKEESENASLKLNIKKAKIMASSPITSWQINEKL